MQMHPFCGLLLVALMPTLHAQSLIQPPASPAVRLPAETTSGNRGQLQQLQQVQQVQPAPAVLSDPEQRPAARTPVPDKGPANAQPTTKKPVQPLPAVPMPATVIDANGKPVRGALQVSPNRVYDPATGRYYQTTPSGQQQKIVD